MSAVHFAVHPSRAAGVNRAESRLERHLLLVNSVVTNSAEDAARRRQRDWPKPKLPKSLLRKVQAGVLDLLNLGVRDAREEMREASRVRFAEEPVIQADIDAYRRYADVLAEQMVSAQYDLLKEVVIAGLRSGMTDREIGAEIRSADLLQSAAHARTWARTESTRYYTIGRSAEIEAAGDAVWGYEYVVIEDNRTTDICQGYAGKRVAKADMKRWPPFHYNCRTTVMAVMAEWVTDEDPAPADLLLRDAPDPSDGFGRLLPLAA